MNNDHDKHLYTKHYVYEPNLSVKRQQSTSAEELVALPSVLPTDIIGKNDSVKLFIHQNEIELKNKKNRQITKMCILNRKRKASSCKGLFLALFLSYTEYSYLIFFKFCRVF